LDEHFFLFYEEVDWCLRLARAGGRILYQPRAQVYHRWGAGAGQRLGESACHNYRSRFRYWRKHGGRVAAALTRASTVLTALGWIAGRTLLTLAGRRPAGEWRVCMRQYSAIATLALGFRGCL